MKNHRIDEEVKGKRGASGREKGEGKRGTEEDRASGDLRGEVSQALELN